MSISGACPAIVSASARAEPHDKAQPLLILARDAAQGMVGEAVRVDVLVVDRAGNIVGESG